MNECLSSKDRAKERGQGQTDILGLGSSRISPSRQMGPDSTKGKVKVKLLSPTLCNPVDCNLLGFSVHGILQARILEWVAISFSRGSSRPRDRTPVSRMGGRHFNRLAFGGDMKKEHGQSRERPRSKEGPDTRSDAASPRFALLVLSSL